jgi:hypothetical protein
VRHWIGVGPLTDASAGIPASTVVVDAVVVDVVVGAVVVGAVVVGAVVVGVVVVGVVVVDCGAVVVGVVDAGVAELVVLVVGRRYVWTYFLGESFGAAGDRFGRAGGRAFFRGLTAGAVAVVRVVFGADRLLGVVEVLTVVPAEGGAVAVRSGPAV